MNYILKDHLGSIQYVTDNQGTVVETLSFNPSVGEYGVDQLTLHIELKKIIKTEYSLVPFGQAGEGLNTASNIASVVGIAGTGLGMIDGTFRLAKSGKFSPGYYSSGWSTGNQYVKSLYSISKVGKGLSTGASIVTTSIAYYQIANGTQQPITYVDATVGTIGLSAMIASYYSGIAIPYVGEFVAIYGTTRLFWDLGQD